MHFNVIVISKLKCDVDRLLAPFNECTEEPEFLEFESQMSAEEMRNDFEQNNNGEYGTAEEYADYMFGYKYDEGTNSYGIYSNPRGAWDWYEIGGRWSNMLLLKDGTKCDQARIKDVDLDGHDEKQYDKYLRVYRHFVYGITFDDDCIKWISEDYVKSFKSDVEYASYMTRIVAHDIVTPDGEWHDGNSVGMFDVSKDTIQANFDMLKKFLESYPDCYVTMVDCHT